MATFYNYKTPNMLENSHCTCIRIIDYNFGFSLYYRTTWNVYSVSNLNTAGALSVPTTSTHAK